MNIIIAGNGMIGKERIKALEMLHVWIVGIVDPNNTPYQLQNSIFVRDFDEIPKEIINKTDWIFVCTPHDQTGDIVKFALGNSINVLAEKPLGRTFDEYERIMYFHLGYPDNKVNVGFNYRFYKGVNQLLTDCKNNLFGDLISVNMVLSLGDATGSEKTWRLDPQRAGRGAILDPGIHLIDLAMLISGNSLRKISTCSVSDKFWNTGFEEEAHVLAHDKDSCIYNIQASKVHWRNTFRIEVNGTDGYGIVEGRNRHYGNQTYRRGKRWGWQGGKSQRESEELVIDYDGEDSFFEETKAVLFGTDSIIKPATHFDNERCLKFIE